jgi:putative hemolysin
MSVRAESPRGVRAAAPLAVVLVVAAALPAAGAPDHETVAPTEFSMPNPAAFYVTELGYEYEIVWTEEGERGVCVLPDGRRVDAWEFYRGAVAPEHGYCALAGYGTATRASGDGAFTGECAVCVAEDGAEIGTAWDLMGLGARLIRRIPGPPADASPLRTHGEPPGERLTSGARDTLPSSFNWLTEGGVTRIRDQGACGSCWAFTAVACLESAIRIKDGVEVDLSEQWLLSCNADGWSCNGGHFAHRYHQRKPDPCGDTGAVLEVDFPYAADDLPCDCPYPHPYVTDAWGHLAGSEGMPTVPAIKEAMLEYGPIDVALYINQAFVDYTGGVYDACENQWYPNHTVLLVGWDDEEGPYGAWLLKNSWGTEWGIHGYMWIQYGCGSVGYGACWDDYRDPIRTRLPDGPPVALTPGEETVVAVRIEELTDTLVPGSALLHYRYRGGDFATEPLVGFGGDAYAAVLPPADCLDSPEFYVSAEGGRFGTVTCPARAPAETYRCAVGVLATVFSDDFESDQGWRVSDGANLIDGSWERGVPIGGGDRGDPPTDFDGSGSCYLTCNEDGDSDVDGGATRLFSPELDVGDADGAVVTYALWYTNNAGNNPNQDVFEIHARGVTGGWIHLDTVGPLTPVPVGWYERSLVLGDAVDWSSGFSLMFRAVDDSPWSIVEAGLDAFSALRLECDPSGIGDDEGIVPSLALGPSQPNPFSAATTIRYAIPREATVELTVYAVSGRVVRTLVSSDRLRAGEHTALWDGRDDSGRPVASGTYFYRLAVGDEVVARRMILIK